MSMTRFICAVLIITASLLFSAPHAGSEERVYINGIDANFPPFSFVDRQGEPDGFDVRSLDWIAGEMKFKVKHQAMDWDEIISSLKSGRTDMVASGLIITEERRKDVSFTMPYWKIRKVLICKSDAKISVEQALADGSKIGVQQGSSEAKWIRENLIKKGGRKIDLVQYDSGAAVIGELVKGRIVAAAMDEVPAAEASRRRSVKVLGGFGMQDVDFGYAVRKEDGELLKKLDEGIKRLMKSSYWAELRKRYIDRQ